MPSKSKPAAPAAPAKKPAKEHAPAKPHAVEAPKPAADTKHPEPTKHSAPLAAAASATADATKEFKEKALENLSGDLNDKIRYLIRLSKEQGYLTYADINEALPESVDNPEDIENVIRPPEPRDRHPRSAGSRQLQAAPGGGRGGGIAHVE